MAERSIVDLLLADHRHFGDSLQHNEDVGEKRFNYFLTLVAAVSTALVAMHTAEDVFAADELAGAVSVGLFLLLLVGVLTYLRMLQRNKVTDEYQQTLRKIRGTIASLCPEQLPEPYDVPVRLGGPLPDSFPRGGLAETIAIIDGVLLFALWVSLGAADEPVMAVIGALVSLLLARVLWRIAKQREKGGGTSATFRAGAGAVVLGADGRVMVFERRDVPGAWQYPQGGVESWEQPETALFRELGEETGLGAGELVVTRSFPTPLAYELPEAARTRKTGRGQAIRWYVLTPKHDDAAPRLPEGGEFRAWRWADPHDVARNAVDFRRPSYEQLAAFVEELRA